jgi:hypothetical protein
MMSNTSITTALTATAALSMLTLGGCASAVDRDYGKAVHQMVAAQVYHPETLRQPSPNAPEGVDPDSAKGAVDAMRKDTAERTQTQQPIIFTYGASGAPSQ